MYMGIFTRKAIVNPKFKIMFGWGMVIGMKNSSELVELKRIMIAKNRGNEAVIV